MNNLVCMICEYSTKRQGNYDRHINSNKHNKKIQESINKTQKKHSLNYSQIKSQSSPTQVPPKSHLSMCQYCNRGFSRPDTLTKHMKSCINKLNTEKELRSQIKNLNTKLHQYKKDVLKKDEENIHYKEEMEYYKRMLMEAGGLVKKSVSALTYSIKNYNDAPPIQPITMDEIESFNNNEKNIIDDVLSSYKHKTLGKYLGDFILKIYKKDDPKNQSIWNADDSRLTYLVKILLNNKSSNWIVDKKGIKTTTYLIEPLLSHIKALLVIYQTNYTTPEICQNAVELEMLLENSKKIMELVNDIDDGIIGKDILRHISSHLKFNEQIIN